MKVTPPLPINIVISMITLPVVSVCLQDVPKKLLVVIGNIDLVGVADGVMNLSVATEDTLSSPDRHSCGW